eukprot:SAG31_NODE_45821_length_257_cov_0.658228_1_plen_57_part_00
MDAQVVVPTTTTGFTYRADVFKEQTGLNIEGWGARSDWSMAGMVRHISCSYDSAGC